MWPYLTAGKMGNIVLCPTNTLGTEKGRINGVRGESLQWKVWLGLRQIEFWVPMGEFQGNSEEGSWGKVGLRIRDFH